MVEKINTGKIDPKEAIKKAREEIADETMKEAVKLLKAKLRQQKEARVVLENITREIEDLELQIEQGNV